VATSSLSLHILNCKYCKSKIRKPQLNCPRLAEALSVATQLSLYRSADRLKTDRLKSDATDIHC